MTNTHANKRFVDWRCLLIQFILSAFVVLEAGCGKDYKRTYDEDVQSRLLSQLEKREAIPFFEQNGRYYDHGDPPRTTVDQDIVLPLLRQLNKIAATDQWVMLSDQDNNRAFALLVALPRDPKTVDLMAAAVQETDDKFSGFILQQWGHDWLSIILIDRKQYEFLKQRNPNIDKQR